MRLLPAAAFRRRLNWRSVACSAWSGILLMSPMLSSASAVFSRRSNSSASRSCEGASAGLTIGRCLSNSSVMPGLNLFRGLEPLMPRAGLLEGLVDVLDNVGAVFDADRWIDGFRQHARHALLFAGHLAVGGRGGVAGERFRVADIDQARDQTKRVVKGLASLQPALDAEG